MRIYFKLNKIPKLEGLKRKDAQAVHKMSCAELFNRHRILYHALCAGVLAGFGVWLGQGAHVVFQAEFKSWHPIVGGAFCAGLGGFISWQLNVNYLRQYYSKYRKIYEKGNPSLNAALPESSGLSPLD